MKKLIKWLLISIALIIVLVFANGCYYVFRGQERAMVKLREGRELNLYECCSIYTMHMAVWMFGWPISPEAAKEAFWLHFKNPGQMWNFSYSFYGSEVITSHPNWEKKKPFKVSWPSISELSDKELRYALAYSTINTQVMFTEYGEPILECRVEYQNVKYRIKGITIYTGLFQYLQQIGWLHPYTSITFTPESFWYDEYGNC